MIFPEKTLHGKSDFLAWCVGGTYADGDKAPGVYNIFFDENHNVVSVASKIAGDQADQGKDHNRDPDQHGNETEQPAQNAQFHPAGGARKPAGEFV